jgi:glycine/D-amino acid oxidase-like deaminating enzyme
MVAGANRGPAVSKEASRVGTTAIVGGGVIGLLTAYELQRRGIDVAMIDKSDFGAGQCVGNRFFGRHCSTLGPDRRERLLA